MSLADSLAIVVLMSTERHHSFDRAAARWAARLALERRLSLEDLRFALAAVTALPHHPELAKAPPRRHLRPPRCAERHRFARDTRAIAAIVGPGTLSPRGRRDASRLHPVDPGTRQAAADSRRAPCAGAANVGR